MLCSVDEWNDGDVADTKGRQEILLKHSNLSGHVLIEMDDWWSRVCVLHSPIELRFLLQASLGDPQQVLFQLTDPVGGFRQPPPHLLPLL